MIGVATSTMDRKGLSDRDPDCMVCHRTAHMRIQLAPNSGVPLFRQVANQVKAAFLRGHLAPGDRLPSVRELAKELAINPTTVVKAYEQLERERVITCRQGQGAFVTGGVEPLHQDEREELLSQHASELAREGRRLGMSEQQLLALLESELKKLRPRKVK
ncbi:MAG: GntR family transcriptional regulator [Planctomycetota bacterium]